MDNNLENNQQRNYSEEISLLFHDHLTPKIIAERLKDYHENDIADALSLMNKEERIRLYNLVDAATLADIFEYAGDDNKKYFAELDLKKRVEILSKTEVSSAIDYLQNLNKDERKTLLSLLPEEERKEIFLASSFDDDEIGSYLSTNYIEILSNLSIKDAMKELVNQASENDNISTLYVKDPDGTYAGAIDLKDLITARADASLADITMTSYPYVYADEEIADCVIRLKDYSEDSIPILGHNNHLEGVLTASDLTELVDQELGEDYAKFAGLASEEDLHESLKDSIKKRLPWLLILLVLGMIVSSVVGMFENVVESLPLIISFQSLILDMAGNVGTQSLAVTIRVLSDENLDFKEKLTLAFKESRVSLCNGIILGILSIIFIGLYLMLIKGQTHHIAFSVSLCVGIALLVSMFLSGILGTVVPMLFKKIGIDPAVASGPLITTLNDLVAVVVYYGLAYFMLIKVLGL